MGIFDAFLVIPGAPKLPNSTAVNQSAAATYFKGYASPIIPSENGTWATGGAAIDEWNPAGAMASNNPCYVARFGCFFAQKSSSG